MVDVVHHALALGAMLGLASLGSMIGGTKRASGVGMEGSVALGCGAALVLPAVTGSWVFTAAMAAVISAATFTFDRRRAVGTRNDLLVGFGSAVGMAGLLWTESEVAPLSVLFASAMSGLALGVLSNRSWPNPVRRALSVPAVALGAIGLFRFGASNGIGVLFGAAVVVAAARSWAGWAQARSESPEMAGVALVASGLGLVILAGALGAAPQVLAPIDLGALDDAGWVGRAFFDHSIATYVALPVLVAVVAVRRTSVEQAGDPGPAWSAVAAGALGGFAGAGVVMGLGMGWQGSTTTAGIGTVALAVAAMVAVTGRPRLIPVLALVWATLWVMSQAEGPDPSAVAAAPIGSSGWPSLAPYVLAALAVIFARRLPPRSSAEG